jgi:hypothetical protein
LLIVCGRQGHHTIAVKAGVGHYGLLALGILQSYLGLLSLAQGREDLFAAGHQFLPQLPIGEVGQVKAVGTVK